jgi:protein SCO1/2
MRIILALVFILLLTMVAAGQGQVPILQGVGIDQHVGAALPLDVPFRDESGATVRLRDLLHPGRPAILSLVYYRCPMLCTLVLNDTLAAAKVLPLDVGKDYDLITVSFDPAETPELAAAKRTSYLAAYKRPGAAEGWHFLTGDAESIAKLTSAVGFRYRWDAAGSQFVHPAGITMVTPDGYIARYFFGVQYDPVDLRLSLVEASQNRIGTVTDKLLLYCYHYDPLTGRYGWAVQNLLRAGGAVTVGALGTLMFLLVRYDRQRTRRLMPPADAAPRAGGRGEVPS